MSGTRARDDVRLVEAADGDFERMLDDGSEVRPGLRVPPGGVDKPFVLAIVRRIVAELHAAGSRSAWLVVAHGEVVGLCSYRRAPRDGEVELGYGIAPSRRGRGYATAAVALMIDAAARDENVRRLVAETSVANVASTRVLEANGFEAVERLVNEEDGEVIRWRRAVPAPAVQSS
ncbi:MAG TPA: GNAT family N-acetyltransferase [Candidatus Baltobacteraceae bacterium]|nr:GNAT family N-acetyltransferase [Candidatus Baltobacteraceae bacterium]